MLMFTLTTSVVETCGRCIYHTSCKDEYRPYMYRTHSRRASDIFFQSFSPKRGTVPPTPVVAPICNEGKGYLPPPLSPRQGRKVKVSKGEGVERQRLNGGGWMVEIERIRWKSYSQSLWSEGGCRKVIIEARRLPGGAEKKAKGWKCGSGGAG